MIYRYEILKCFVKQLKPFEKKFPNLEKDIIKALEQFEKENGIPLGNNNYKVRVKSSDLRKGKSGGFRVLMHLIEIDRLLIPIGIFFKSERVNISKAEIKQSLQNALVELESINTSNGVSSPRTSSG